MNTSLDNCQDQDTRELLCAFFWQHVQKTDGCWLWTGKTIDSGYGRVATLGFVILAHRLSWEIHFGPIPQGLQVLHHCDNRPCVRPEDLFVGTQAENVADMYAKGRQPLLRGIMPHGTNHWAARYPDEVIEDIRRRHESGQGILSIARLYGMSKGYVWNVAHYRKRTES